MSNLIKKEALRWWVSEDQVLIENVYMLKSFGSHYGRDERFLKHHRKQLEVIDKLEISDKLVLPFIYPVKGVRTVILIEFDMDKVDNIAPLMIEKFEEDNIIAMLEVFEEGV